MGFAGSGVTLHPSYTTRPRPSSARTPVYSTHLVSPSRGQRTPHAPSSLILVYVPVMAAISAVVSACTVSAAKLSITVNDLFGSSASSSSERGPFVAACRWQKARTCTPRRQEREGCREISTTLNTADHTSPQGVRRPDTVESSIGHYKVFNWTLWSHQYDTIESSI